MSNSSSDFDIALGGKSDRNLGRVACMDGLNVSLIAVLLCVLFIFVLVLLLFKAGY